MILTTSADSFFIFDLDDTLYPEMAFLRSAYREIAVRLAPFVHRDLFPQMLERRREGDNVFQWIIRTWGARIPGIGMEKLLEMYRLHVPDISLGDATAQFLLRLRTLSIPAGLITDGRSVTQRNKLHALGIGSYFRDVIISEEFGSAKPDPRNYLYFTGKYPGKEFVFFGDNTEKDFIVPARIGWTTVCIKDAGEHIHTQDLHREPAPDYLLSSFSEVMLR
jgi:putative hydrolase of the HAD superfamily